MNAKLRTTALAPLREGGQALVVAPSIGTAVSTLWEETTTHLAVK